MIRTLCSVWMIAVLFSTAGCEMTELVEDDGYATIGAGFDVRVIDMNIAGGMSHAGSPAALTPVLEQIDAWGPDIVMLQEVCAGQRDHFEAVLGPAGWTVAFAAMRPHPKCGANQEIGVLLASPHAMTGIDARSLGHPDRDRDQVFKLLCANINTRKRVYACTTHLRAFTSPEDNEARRAQAKRIHRLLDPIIFNQGKAVIVGGDFNAKPNHNPLNWMYRLTNDNRLAGTGNFHEADQTAGCNSQSGACRDGAATHRKVGATSGGGKLDYVFFSRNRFSGKKNISGHPIWTGTSDHALYRARARVKGTDGGVDARLNTSDDAEPVDSGDEGAGTPDAAGCGDNNECWAVALGVTPYTIYQVSNPSDRRLSPIIFDARFYLNLYPDVHDVAVTKPDRLAYAEYHWLHHGIQEGRIGSPTFDPVAYMNYWPDVSAAYGWNNYDGAIYHYMVHGRFEGRRGSTMFDPSYYFSRYPDLQAALGWDHAALLDHFITYGLYEGRQGAADFAPAWYLGVNPDVRAAWGQSYYRGGLTHYLRFGRWEGRSGAP